jgi:hypothetical protein
LLGWLAFCWVDVANGFEGTPLAGALGRSAMSGPVSGVDMVW